jgi:N-dimethylarginine dimethylaminohydrolase
MPRLFMCRPDHFVVSYAINPWMDPAGWAAEGEILGATARREWQALHGALASLGASIDLVPAMPDLPDLVFTANAAIVMDGKALLARFLHPERQREEPHFERAFRALAARGELATVERLPEGLVLEGAGDCVWDRARGLFWMGYGQRSDRASRAVVEDAFGLEVVALELADPRFYHIDTTFCPLSRGEAIYFPGAFTGDGLAAIRARIALDLRIEIELADASTLAANAICLGDAIVLSQCSADLRRRLEARRYRVIEIPLSAFLRSGGSASCLTLQLDRRSGAAPSMRADDRPAVYPAQPAPV